MLPHTSSLPMVLAVHDVFLLVFVVMVERCNWWMTSLCDVQLNKQNENSSKKRCEYRLKKKERKKYNKIERRQVEMAFLT